MVSTSCSAWRCQCPSLLVLVLQIGYASGKAPDKEEPEEEDRRLPNGKWLYEGKEYDYLIPTEIEEDFGVVRKLKLPYNKDSKLWTIHWHSHERSLPSPSLPHPHPPLPCQLTHGSLHRSSYRNTCCPCHSLNRCACCYGNCLCINLYTAISNCSLAQALLCHTPYTFHAPFAGGQSHPESGWPLCVHRL